MRLITAPSKQLGCSDLRAPVRRQSNTTSVWVSGASFSPGGTGSTSMPTTCHQLVRSSHTRAPLLLLDACVSVSSSGEAGVSPSTSGMLSRTMSSTSMVQGHLYELELYPLTTVSTCNTSSSAFLRQSTLLPPQEVLSSLSFQNKFNLLQYNFDTSVSRASLI